MAIRSHNTITGEVADQAATELQTENRLCSDLKNKVHGIVLASISGVLFTANNFVINQSGVDVGDVILVRTVIQVIIYVLILMYRGEDFLPPTRIKKIFTILQGLTGSIAFISSLVSVSLIDVPDALSIIFACPLVTIFLSAVMLRDKLNPVNMCAGLQLFAGVILVCKPPFIFDTLNALQLYIDPVEADETYTVGVVLAITACVTTGIMDVLVAKCEDVSTAVLVLWTAIIGIVIAVFYGLLHPGSNILSLDVVNIPALDWAIFAGLAVSGLLAFTTLTRSLQLISPNLVASLRSLELVLAFLVQAVITGQPPQTLSWLGGGLILIGVLMLSLQSWILSCPRSILSFLKEIFTYRERNVGPTEYTSLLP